MLDTVPLLFTRYLPPSKLSWTAGGIILVLQARTARVRVPCPFVQRLAEAGLDLRSELKPRIVASRPSVTSQLQSLWHRDCQARQTVVYLLPLPPLPRPAFRFCSHDLVSSSFRFPALASPSFCQTSPHFPSSLPILIHF